MVALEKELLVVTVPPLSADAIPLTLRRHGGTARQVFAIAVIGTLVLAVFASRDLSVWLNRMGDDPLLVPLQHAAAGWDRAITHVGLARPAAILRDTTRRALDSEW